MAYPQEHLNPEWIRNGINNDAVEWARSFGDFLSHQQDRKKPLTTSQIRKFFGELKRTQADIGRHLQDLPMLKAQLAYAVGRDNNSCITFFNDELSKGVDVVVSANTESDSVKYFKNFVKIVESVVAFHKFYGGK